MNKLQRLVNSLSRAELAELSNNKLIGKQRKVLDAAIASYRQGDEDRSAMETFLAELTPAHRYEIISVLQVRVLDHLIPNGGLDTLIFLQQRQLRYIFKTQFLRLHRDVIPDRPLAEQREFYYGAYFLLHRFNQPEIDKELIDLCRMEYLRHSTQRKVDAIVLDGIELVYTLPRAFRYSVAPYSITDEYARRVELYRQIAERDGDGRAAFFAAKAELFRGFWGMFSAEHIDTWLPVVRSHIDELDNPVHRGESKFIDALEIDALVIRSDMKAAIKAYERLYEDLSPSEPIYYDTYLALRYAELLLAEEDIHRSKEIAERHCSHLRYVPATFSLTQLELLMALLCICEDDLSAAQQAIKAADVANSKANYVLFADIRLRIVECCIYALRKDFKMLEVMIDRALQLMRFRKLSPTTHSAGKYFMLIRALGRAAQADGILPESQVEHYIMATDGRFGIYSKLIDHVRQSLGVSIPEKN